MVPFDYRHHCPPTWTTTSPLTTCSLPHHISLLFLINYTQQTPPPPAMYCSIDDAPSKRKRDKNPFASRGLDKFSTTKAELEARREKILASSRAKDAASVHFTYRGSNEWVPIIVREQQKLQKQEKPKPESSNTLPPSPPPEQTQRPPVTAPEPLKVIGLKKRIFSWRAGYYWPVVMVLVLVSLVLFGRVFAICCTSICWYMVPTMQQHIGSSGKRSHNKKQYLKRPDDNKMNVKRVAFLQEVPSPRNNQHAQGKRG